MYDRAGVKMLRRPIVSRLVSIAGMPLRAVRSRLVCGCGRNLSMRPQEASSTLRRLVIGLFGEMNSGKSTIMNALTQQATAIVDKTPGTTADVKTALIQLHGLGPCKLLDTAGVDDVGELGLKKREKALQALKEVDVALIVLDPARKLSRVSDAGKDRIVPQSLRLLSSLVHEVVSRGRRAMLVFNVRGGDDVLQGEAHQLVVKGIEDAVQRQATVALDARREGDAVPALLPSFVGDFNQQETGKALSLHLVEHVRGLDQAEVDLVPKRYHDKVVLLNIPMDAETPQGRLLRPQAMVQDYCLRNYVPTLAHRMHMPSARSPDPEAREAEKHRFVSLIKLLPRGSLVITDSQAIDIVHEWTRDLGVDVTTFSVCIMNYMSGGGLQRFVDGIQALQSLCPGDRVLVAEACNHVRIPEQCDDIGLVQIPRRLRKLLPEVPLELHHAYGREFVPFSPSQGDMNEAANEPNTNICPESQSVHQLSTRSLESLKQYKLVVHCGACMIDSQKLRARIEDCRDAHVPMTNYGLLLAYAACPEAFARVVAPWGISLQAVPEKSEGREQTETTGIQSEAEHTCLLGLEDREGK